MSGLEIVSVVLGLYPLIIDGVDYYQKLADRVNKRKAVERAKEFTRCIQLEHAKFQVVIDILLNGTEVHTGSDPTQDAYNTNTDAFRTLVIERLNSKQAKSFFDAVIVLEELLRKLEEAFALPEKTSNQDLNKKLVRINSAYLATAHLFSIAAMVSCARSSISTGCSRTLCVG